MGINSHANVNDYGDAYIAGAIEFVSHLTATPYSYVLSSTRTQPRPTPLQDAIRVCEGAMRRYAQAQTQLEHRRKWADRLHAYVIKRASIALTSNRLWSDALAAQYAALVDCVYARVQLAEMTVSMERYEVTQAEKRIEALIEGGQ